MTAENTYPSLAEIYDEFAETYESNRGIFDMSAVLDDFLAHLPQARGTLLDLGCGAGEPFARTFTDRGWEVTGVDFSARMVELASRFTPAMRTILADMREVSFPSEQFDAITAIYSLFHLPRTDHSAMFDKFCRWLRPGGKLLFTYATRHYTGHAEYDGEIEFMERELFYSHDTLDELRSKLAAAGLEVVAEDYREIGGETFLWITGSKPRAF